MAIAARNYTNRIFEIGLVLAIERVNSEQSTDWIRKAIADSDRDPFIARFL